MDLVSGIDEELNKLQAQFKEPILCTQKEKIQFQSVERTITPRSSAKERDFGLIPPSEDLATISLFSLDALDHLIEC